MAGTFILSLDCEGKWGVADHLDAGIHAALTDAALRRTYGEIVEALDRREIPATFAVVDFFTAALRGALDFLAAALRVPVVFFAAAFEADFFAGTLPPSLRASDRPMAIACLRLVTFLPEPLRSVPRLRSCIARFTLLDAFLL